MVRSREKGRLGRNVEPMKNSIAPEALTLLESDYSININLKLRINNSNNSESFMVGRRAEKGWRYKYSTSHALSQQARIYLNR